MFADTTAELKATSGVSCVFVNLSSTCRTTSHVGGVLLKEEKKGWLNWVRKEKRPRRQRDQCSGLMIGRSGDLGTPTRLMML